MDILAITTHSSTVIIYSILRPTTSTVTGWWIPRWAFHPLQDVCALRSRTQNGFTITFLMKQRLLPIDIGQVSLKVGERHWFLRDSFPIEVLWFGKRFHEKAVINCMHFRCAGFNSLRASFSDYFEKPTISLPLGGGEMSVLVLKITGAPFNLPPCII